MNLPVLETRQQILILDIIDLHTTVLVLFPIFEIFKVIA